VSFRGLSGDWRRDTLEIPLIGMWIDQTAGSTPQQEPPPRSIATATLASISNDRTAVWAGWAVDRTRALWKRDTGLITLYVDLACRDSDGDINRIQYSVITRGLLQPGQNLPS
jgi:hypothetical protein